jgi:hypothetical protein
MVWSLDPCPELLRGVEAARSLAMIDPIARLNAALEGRYRVEREQGTARRSRPIPSISAVTTQES